MNRNIILCDLDGTLADCSHRLHFIQETPKKWTEFFAECHKDVPIQHVVEFVRMLWSVGYDIWITSGRSDECKEKTVEWLCKHGISYNKLIMRKAGDYTDDGTLKKSWIENRTIPIEQVAFSLDDRTRVVKAWRSIGVPCFQVRDGDF